MNHIFLLSFFYFFALQAMDDQLGFLNNQNNQDKYQSQIDFWESRVSNLVKEIDTLKQDGEIRAKEIAQLKTENEDLKEEVKSLLPHKGRKVIQNKEREKMIIKNNGVNLDYQTVIIYEDQYGKEGWEIVTDPVKEKIYFLNHRVKILEEKELENQNKWKFGNMSQGTKALICWSITALFVSTFYVTLISLDKDYRIKKETPLKKSFLCLFLALKSIIWLSYSWNQKL